MEITHNRDPQSMDDVFTLRLPATDGQMFWREVLDRATNIIANRIAEEFLVTHGAEIFSKLRAGGGGRAMDECYTCVHRLEVAGSAHSACAHPATEATRRSPFMQLAATVGKRGGDQLMAMAQEFDEGPQRAANALGIKANFHGIKNGWFVWPVNFDPVWLEQCNGFEAKASAEPVSA